MNMDPETAGHYEALGLSPGASHADVIRAALEISISGDRNLIERSYLARGAIRCRHLEEEMGLERFSLKKACEVIGGTEAIIHGFDVGADGARVENDLNGDEAIRLTLNRYARDHTITSIEMDAFDLLTAAREFGRKQGCINSLKNSRGEFPRALLDKALANLDEFVRGGGGWAQLLMTLKVDVIPEIFGTGTLPLADHPFLTLSTVDKLSGSEALREFAQYVTGHSEMIEPSTGARQGMHVFKLGDEGFTVTKWIQGQAHSPVVKRNELTVKVTWSNIRRLTVAANTMVVEFDNNVWMTGHLEGAVGNPDPNKVKHPVTTFKFEFPSPFESFSAHNLLMRWLDDKKEKQAERENESDEHDNQGLGIDWFEQTE